MTSDVSSPPISQCLPCLDELLDCAGGREGVAIDDAARAVSLLVEVQNCRFAEVRQAIAECLEVFRRHHVLTLRRIRSAGHEKGF